jgi:hypothetical protein|tara:strand:+ start:1721 stop:2305 length:585 start_codon:yes stop_codon:yes gene_type:complete
MGLLDISSFFTGLVINLLLITLICYYFKQKYDNLENSQREQAKILYELLTKQSTTLYNGPTETKEVQVSNDESDFESESESEISESDHEEEEVKQEGQSVETKQISYDENPEEDYNKMNVKTLRELLSSNGIKTNNKMKKNELIHLVTNQKSNFTDLAFEESTSNIDTQELNEDPNEEYEENEVHLTNIVEEVK